MSEIVSKPDTAPQPAVPFGSLTADSKVGGNTEVPVDASTLFAPNPLALFQETAASTMQEASQAEPETIETILTKYSLNSDGTTRFDAKQLENIRKLVDEYETELPKTELLKDLLEIGKSDEDNGFYVFCIETFLQHSKNLKQNEQLGLLKIYKAYVQSGNGYELENFFDAIGLLSRDKINVNVPSRLGVTYDLIENLKDVDQDTKNAKYMGMAELMGVSFLSIVRSSPQIFFARNFEKIVPQLVNIADKEILQVFRKAKDFSLSVEEFNFLASKINENNEPQILEAFKSTIYHFLKIKNAASTIKAKPTM